MNSNTPTPTTDHPVVYSPEELNILDRLAALAVRHDLSRLIHRTIKDSDGEDRYEIANITLEVDPASDQRVTVSLYDHLTEGNMDATIRLAAEMGAVIVALSNLCPDENPAMFDIELVLSEDIVVAEDSVEAVNA